tara:strand:+ start:1138 stop:1890 length:753 start_codon:yes stop_codon:yes gene_type:complete
LIEKISNRELEKFSRQILIEDIGIKGQLKIFKSKILIIGCGGLGSVASTYLAMSGVKKMGLVDMDKVELSNISRQLLFYESDVGKYKVDVLKEKLNRTNPETGITTFKQKFSKKNSCEILNGYKIILDCTDNFAAKYLINDQCHKNRKILISAALFNFELQLFAFKSWSKGLPCYRCIFPNKSRESANCSNMGILSTVAGIGGILQANLALNIILHNSKKFYKNFYLFNAISNENRLIRIDKDKKCRVCR